MTSRRQFLQYGAAALGAAGFAGGLPTLLRAANSHSHQTAGGATLEIYPVQHASLVLQLPDGVIYGDPVGGAGLYEGLPSPDLILITHEHGDHYDAQTLSALMGDSTQLLTNPAVYDMLPGELRERASAIGNGDTAGDLLVDIEAVPAYNLTEERLKYHPEGRDNGYVLSIDGSRVYIAGDTEAVPEMRALENIDIAFVPMNLPYTMAIEQAADGVLDFKPQVVYPYHHKGSDIAAFAALVREGDAGIDVVQTSWYG